MEPEEGRVTRCIEDDAQVVTFFFEGYRLTTIDIEIKDYGAIPPADLENKVALGQWCHALLSGLVRAMHNAPRRVLPLPEQGRDGKPMCPACNVPLRSRPQTCPSGEPVYQCGKCGVQYRRDRPGGPAADGRRTPT